jgi:hypothetical protein
MSSRELKKKLKRLRDRQNTLIDQILNAPPMLRGSFTRVSTRCGKPTCWCAKTLKGHAHTRLTWSEQGKMTTRKVLPEDVEQIKELTAHYRAYRRHQRELVHLQQQIQETVTQLKVAVNEKTRKPLGFVAATPKT